MKKTLMLSIAMFVAAAAQAVSLADARAKIGDVISEPAKLTALVKELSLEDQKAFIGAVNEAIGKMPGSNEAKAATCLNANKAMLRAAQKTGNMTTLLAEVFATVPIEMLPIINESFAADLFNRAADPNKVYLEHEFTNIVVQAMHRVHERDKTSDNGSVRDAFAALMFVRASNGTAEGLIDALVAVMDPSYREVAKSEWIMTALGMDGKEKSYEPLLGAADAGREANGELATKLAGPQLLEALLMDLRTGLVDREDFVSMGGNMLPGRLGGSLEPGGDVRPINTDPIPRKIIPVPEPEPGPYNLQN